MVDRNDFPFLRNNPQLIYLDNAATTHKPQEVLSALTDFYTFSNAPVHRGIYTLAENATNLYEQARESVASFIGARSHEVVFTKGTTEGINFVASSWAEQNLREGDEIILTELEHHSNILPWMRLEKKKGIIISYARISDAGDLDYEHYASLLNTRTKLVACTHTSNALGTRLDLPFMINAAHAQGARVLIDVAQAVGHEAINVGTLKPDFLVFSGHKMGGPTGIGVLYIAHHVHAEMIPYQVGGGMVYTVDFHEATYAKPPHRYEAGTPPIAQAIGLAAAIDYFKKTINFDNLKKHEAALCAQLIEGLQAIPSLRIIGPINELKKSGHMVSFMSEEAHAHDIAAFLDSRSIAVRAGNHCAQPLHKKLGISSSLRASFYGYTTHDDITALLSNLKDFSHI